MAELGKKIQFDNEDGSGVINLIPKLETVLNRAGDEKETRALIKEFFKNIKPNTVDNRNWVLTISRTFHGSKECKNFETLETFLKETQKRYNQITIDSAQLRRDPTKREGGKYGGWLVEEKNPPRPSSDNQKVDPSKNSKSKREKGKENQAPMKIKRQ